ncbi:MAG: hypothetical protein ACI8RC_000601 [Ilumatobacter sp.]|jgi:hypothetical protein
MPIPIGDSQMSGRPWLTGAACRIARPHRAAGIADHDNGCDGSSVVDSAKPPRHTMPVCPISASMSLEQTFIDRADLVK